MQKNIAILGTAPSSVMLAPFDDPEWEIWACSMANMDVLPASVERWFELHHLDLVAGGGDRAARFIEFLGTKPHVWLSAPDPRLPRAHLLPVVDLIDEFGPYFWGSSIDWMLAYAITLKPKAIGIWGVDMGAKTEYERQRPSAQYYMQKAAEREIAVHVPVQSDLLEPLPLYGVCGHDPAWRKMHVHTDELEKRRAAADNKREKAELELSFLMGALEQANKDQYTYTGNLYRGKVRHHGATMSLLQSGIHQDRSAHESLPTETKGTDNGDGRSDERSAAGGTSVSRKAARNGQAVSGAPAKELPT